MKRIFSLALGAFIAGASTAMAFDLKDALKGLGSGNDTTVEGIAGALGSVLSTDKIDISSINGTWKYSAPAVTFKSDNLLQKAGGAAASSMITGKLEPIYKTTGIDNMTLTIDETGNFQMKLRSITLNGVIEPLTDADSQANFTFNFQTAGKNIGKINSYVEKSLTGTLKITFDVSKLITILEKVSSVAGNSTLKTLSSALSSYDGLCAGFELTK